MRTDNAPTTWPGWRSLLFVPVTNRSLVHKAASRGADALILDLEDGVAAADKPAARAAAPDGISHLHGEGAAVLVRVNAAALDLVRDLAACVRPGLRAVILPKADQPARLMFVDELLRDLEAEAGMPPGEIGLIPLVESAAGLLTAPELAAASARVMALALGPEDLALDLGGEPTGAVLTEPARRIAWSARAAGRVAVGFPGSIANITDHDRLQADLRAARMMGYSGALCIHPGQIAHCHQAFAISAEAAEKAQRVVDAHDRAEQSGAAVCTLDGEMIDRPVVLRAQATLAAWRRQTE